MIKKVRRNPENTQIKAKLKSFSKKIKSWIRIEKEKYYSTINDLPPQKKWSILNKLCGNSNKKSSNNKFKIEHGNNIITDPCDLANLFNRFFVDVSKEVASSVTNGADQELGETDDFFQIPHCPHSIFLSQ